MNGPTEQENSKEYLNAFVKALDNGSLTALNVHHPEKGSTGAWVAVLFNKDGTTYKAHIHAGSPSSKGFPILPENINIYTEDDKEKKCTIFIDGSYPDTVALTEQQLDKLRVIIKNTKPLENRIPKVFSKKKRRKRGKRRTKGQWKKIRRGARNFKEYSPKSYKTDIVPNSFEEWLNDIDTTEDNLAAGYASTELKNDIKAFINAYKGKKLDSKLANKLKLGDYFFSRLRIGDDKFSGFVDEQFGDTYDDYYYDDYDSIDSVDSDESGFPVFGISDNINGHHHHHTADSYNYGHHMHSTPDYVTSDYYEFNNDSVILLEYSILIVSLLFAICLVCSCIFGIGFIIGRYVYYGVSNNNKRSIDVNENNEELSV